MLLLWQEEFFQLQSVDDEFYSVIFHAELSRSVLRGTGSQQFAPIAIILWHR